GVDTETGIDACPGQVKVRVVAVPLRRLPDAVDEFERRTEIREREHLLQMMRALHLPTLQLRLQVLQLFALQRRHAARARFTLLCCQTHIVSPVSGRASPHFSQTPRNTTSKVRTWRVPSGCIPAAA